MLAEQVAIDTLPRKSPLQVLRDRTVRWQLLSMSIIYWSNQMSGMSAVRMEMIHFLFLFYKYKDCSLSKANKCLLLSQISTFSYDIFLEAGIPKHMIRYVTLGLGGIDIITSISCVSTSSLAYLSVSVSLQSKATSALHYHLGC